MNSRNDSHAPARPRRRLLLGAAGAAGAAAITAALAVPAIIGTPSAVTALDQPVSGGPAAMCAVVTPEAVASYGTSFRADVTGIDGDTVTLAVTERFDGEVADTVTTTQGDGAGIDGGPLVFEPDRSYLLTTNSDGMIVTCGVSGEADAGLTAVYTEAFG